VPPGKATGSLDIQRGDKVSVKCISSSDCTRARLANFDGCVVVAALESRELISVGAGEITNYSSAARRAWASRPERQAGRPRATVKDRVAVTLRVDRQLWQHVRALESAGVLAGRTEWFTATLRDENTNWHWLSDKLGRTRP